MSTRLLAKSRANPIVSVTLAMLLRGAAGCEVGCSSWRSPRAYSPLQAGPSSWGGSGRVEAACTATTEDEPPVLVRETASGWRLTLNRAHVRNVLDRIDARRLRWRRSPFRWLIHRWRRSICEVRPGVLQRR